jgi:hypothetical protein
MNTVKTMTKADRMLYKLSTWISRVLEIGVPVLAWYWFGWKAAVLVLLLLLASVVHSFYNHYWFREQAERGTFS